MSFLTFKNQFYDFVTDDPNFCVYMGIEKNLGDLPDPGKNKRITMQGKIKMLNKKLNEIDKDSLNQEDLIDLELYRLHLEQSRLGYELELDNYPHNMRMPVASDIISGPLFMLFANDNRNPKIRLVNIISRLEKVDEFITSYCRNIHNPVQRWVAMELEKVESLPSFMDTLLNWAVELEFKNTKRMKTAVGFAKAALLRYKIFLENCSTSQNIFIGEDQMNLVLKSRGINLSAKELHRIAKDFTLKNREDVDNLKLKLIKKYKLSENSSAEDVQSFLAERFKVEKTTEDFSFVLNCYENENDKILEFINDKKLFPLDLDQKMKIIQTPSFMVPSIPAGAMMPALPMREGTKISMVYLTLSEQLLDEHTEISIPGMMIHEGIPGHHLQFAWAATNKSFIRKIFSANDLSEGWTTMLEDYMLDSGYQSELADEIRFSGKRDIARIGARVAIDLYFMSGDKNYLDIGIDCDLSSQDPFVAAGNLLKEITGFVDERIQGELNWYSQERGYPLSYLTGNHLVWKLKEDFKETFKNDISSNDMDLEFHRRFLQAGNMPVSILSEYMLRKSDGSRKHE